VVKLPGHAASLLALPARAIILTVTAEEAIILVSPFAFCKDKKQKERRSQLHKLSYFVTSSSFPNPNYLFVMTLSYSIRLKLLEA